ncbi:B3/4 domain-containing protein [Nocardia rhizosphaerihabitans]|uniref:B3/B4 domain-containing protein n=1 Tax=Nocardia rhizosphaerihabitans TaxID=1691570 RepID=UPI00366E77AF
MTAFIIDQQVSDLGIHAIAFVVNGITVPEESSPELDHYIETAEKALLASTDPKTLKTEPEFKVFRAVHAQLGKAARSEVAAPETLLRLLHRAGRLPRINPLVDIYNLVSAQTRLAFGSHDLTTITGDVRLAMTTGAEQFVPLGATEPVAVPTGEYAYLDDTEVLCRLEVRQCEKSKATAATTDALFIVHAGPGRDPVDLADARDRLAALLTEHLGARSPIDLETLA